jgi:hypothetical protein
MSGRDGGDGMTSKNRRRGKDLEKFVAKDLGGRRVGILGQEDVILHHGAFSLECKERKKIPVFIRKSMDQAIENAKKWGHRPGFVLHELGDNHEKDTVTILYKDFKAILEREGK